MKENAQERIGTLKRIIQHEAISSQKPRVKLLSILMSMSCCIRGYEGDGLWLCALVLLACVWLCGDCGTCRGDLDRTLVATGSLVDINLALANMVYVPRHQFDSVQNHRDFIELTILDNTAAGRGPVNGKVGLHAA